MRIVALLLVCLVCVLPIDVFAQTAKIDSLGKLVQVQLSKKQDDTNTVKLLNDYAFELHSYNPTESTKYAQIAKDMATHVSYPRGMLDAMNTIANNYALMDSSEKAIALYKTVVSSAQQYGFIKESAAALQGIGMTQLYLSQFDSAMVTLRKALVVIDTLNNPLKIAILNNMGTIFLKRTQFDSAIGQYLAALRIAESIKREDLQVQLLGNIGNIYGDLQKYDKAIEYFERGITIGSTLGNERFLAILYSNVAGNYTGRKEYEKALDYLQKSIVLKEKLQMKSSLSYSFGSIADTYSRMKKNALAIEYMNKAMAIQEELGLKQQFIESNAKIVLDYIALKQFSQAVKYGEKAYSLADTTPDFRYEKRMAAENLVFAFEGLGDFKQALFYQREYTALKDSIFSQESLQKVADIQTKYDTELKDKEILQQQLTISNQNADLQRRNLIILALFSAAIVLGLIFNRFRLKRRADEEIRRKNEEIAEIERQQALEKERRRISQDIHDEVGSGLTKILLLSQNAADTDVKNSEISSTAQGVIDGMQEIIWAINPKNDTLTSLMAFIRSYGRDFVQSANKTFTFEAPENLPSLPLRTDVRRNLFLVVKEALNNAVKHSDANTISITLHSSEGAYTLTIADNGKGFSANAPRTNERGGNGLGNMQQRMEEIGGKYTLETAQNQGTAIRLTIP
jgi:signal transduction histidine kinase